MTAKRFSLADIARDLGVSTCTVSVVLNNRDKQSRISEQTASKIREYCQSIGYQPNIHTRRMQSKIVRNIMFYTSSYSGTACIDNIIAGILGGILDRATAEGVTLTMRCGGIDSADDVIFNSFRSREIDGLILYGTEVPERWQKVFSDESRHVVGINMRSCSCVKTVNINNREISRKMTVDYLLSKGRKNFLDLGGTPLSYPGYERYAGFREALEQYNIDFPEDNFVFCHFSPDEAVEAVKRYVSARGTFPDAVVCANDLMGAAVVEYLKEQKTDIPGKVAVTGGDGVDVVRFLSPKLTGFSCQPILLGKTAFNMLWSKVNGKAIDNVILEGVMTAGESA